MMRFALSLSYKGSLYHGWQVQNDKISIQQIIEEKLSLIIRTPVHTFVSGRTDAGVHAVKQVCHFDVEAVHVDKVKKLLKSLVYRLNSILPEDIVIHEIKPVKSGFHAQRSASFKEYQYFVLSDAKRNVFLREFAWHIPQKLDLQSMRKACGYLKGKHDFTSFCATDSTAQTRIRVIRKITIKKIKFPPPFETKGNLLCFTFVGEGFLKQMVRNLMGTIIAAGLKKITPAQVRLALKSKTRAHAMATAPARGL
ncbi:MAG: hypothetical protein ACD_73C00145G0001, partial [uncultured bacterium]